MYKLNNYLMIQEAAEYLGVSKNTLINWEKQNRIATYRNPVNNYRLYKKEDLEELLNDIKQVLSDK